MVLGAGRLSFILLIDLFLEINRATRLATIKAAIRTNAAWTDSKAMKKTAQPSKTHTVVKHDLKTKSEVSFVIIISPLILKS